MASLENGTTSLSGPTPSELFTAESGFDAGDDGATMTMTASQELSLAESSLDTCDNGVSTPGAPSSCAYHPPRVTYYNVIYNMPDRALCGCFARDQ